MNVKIYVRDIGRYTGTDEGVTREYEERLALLPGFRLEKARRFRQHADRVRCAEAYFLLEDAIKRDFPEQIRLMECVRTEGFAEGENKKPYFRDTRDLYFNLSHSGDRVMCVISRAECGCDVERVAALRENIAGRFFHEGEQEYLRRQGESGECFYKIWTLKESVMKACGKGMALDMRSFCVADTPRVVIDGCGYAIGTPDVDDAGYSYGWCVGSDEDDSPGVCVLTSL